MAVLGLDGDLTERILGCAFRVHAVLGCGFLEKVYENALLHELRKAGLAAESQRPIQVHYDGVLVGDYFADILAEGRVILELKAAQGLEGIHVAQTLNYLKASDLKTALLLNFGTRSLEIKRFLL